MSELMREALRRYQHPQTVSDVREYIRQIAPTPPALQSIRQEAREKGISKMTMKQTDAEVAAVRRLQTGRVRKQRRP